MEDLETSYSPKKTENRWYLFWEKEGFFKHLKGSKKPPYCIVMPPPNVTGSLHMGHALVNTLQDILIRYKRMMGFNVLWIPGTDHAGIATQTVVEKDLIKKTGKTRKEFKREEFLSYVWKWKEEKEKNILNQLRKLGCSCDWSMLSFTMDKKNNKAVKTIFKKMYDEGLIYRGDYLVNWDPLTQTALADDEVEHEEIDAYLYYIRYPLKDGSFVSVATTRPETILGDSALAFYPGDKRFLHLRGKKAAIPIIKREIPIIEDHFVDPEFGSGVLKITPAHDFKDYDIAKRHNLPLINIMAPDGTILKKPLSGLNVKAAREKILEELKKLNLLEKIEPYRHRIGISYRSKATIEPYLSKQWFIKMGPFKKRLIDIVKDGEVEMVPPFWKDVYFRWIENLRDWCISRQLWWGHQIPIWYNIKDPKKMICHDGEGLPKEVEKDPSSWKRDEDVLDTWFSSALWPFSTLGWPEKTWEFETFYPNSILVTGHDILFFWVARMILMGEYATSTPPFHKTFLHGLIYSRSYWREVDGNIFYISQDEKKKYDLLEKLPQGIFSKFEKMSKSKNNVIDPIEIIENFGTDAMRIALISSVTHAQEIDLDRRKFEEFKNFANKIWNGARFILKNISGELDNNEFSKGIKRELFTLEDRWIFSLCNRTIENINNYLENYQFDKASISLYKFFWDQFCCYYLESVKPFLSKKIDNNEVRINKLKLLTIIMIDIIRLLHPITPFITEEIFSLFKKLFSGIQVDKNGDIYTQKTILALQSPACIVARYPQLLDKKDLDKDAEEKFLFIKKLIREILNIRSIMKIPPSEKVDIYINGDLEKHYYIEKSLLSFSPMIRSKDIIFNKKDLPKIASTTLLDDITITIALPKSLIETEKLRLKKRREKLKKNLLALEERLKNREFLKKAPKKIVGKLKIDLKDLKKEILEIDKKL